MYTIYLKKNNYRYFSFLAEHERSKTKLRKLVEIYHHSIKPIEEEYKYFDLHGKTLTGLYIN